MSNYTAGPWHVNTINDSKHIIAVIPSFKVISIFSEQPAVTVHDSDEANARLIAAAPEMLDALKFVKAWHEKRLGGDVWSAIDAAIKKAEGK